MELNNFSSEQRRITHAIWTVLLPKKNQFGKQGWLQEPIGGHIFPLEPAFYLPSNFPPSLTYLITSSHIRLYSYTDTSKAKNNEEQLQKQPTITMYDGSCYLCISRNVQKGQSLKLQILLEHINSNIGKSSVLITISY